MNYIFLKIKIYIFSFLFIHTWNASFKLCILIRSRSLLSSLLRVLSRAVFPLDGFDSFNPDDSVLFAVRRTFLPLCEDSVAHFVSHVFSFVTLLLDRIFPDKTINQISLYDYDFKIFKKIYFFKYLNPKSDDYYLIFTLELFLSSLEKEE